MNQVTLTPSEVMIAATTGVMRRIASFQKKLKNNHGLESGHDWQYDICGAMAEMAFAKWKNLYWSSSVWSMKQPDVGGVQIRSCQSHFGNLILRKGDNPDHTYWLVTGCETTPFIIKGYILGRDGMVDKWWSAPDPKRGGCWLVPAEELKS